MTKAVVVQLGARGVENRAKYRIARLDRYWGYRSTSQVITLFYKLSLFQTPVLCRMLIEKIDLECFHGARSAQIMDSLQHFDKWARKKLFWVKGFEHCCLEYCVPNY